MIFKYGIRNINVYSAAIFNFSIQKLNKYVYLIYKYYFIIYGTAFFFLS